MKVVVPKDPVVVFSHGDSYTGEYGLDNKFITNLVAANDYRVINDSHFITVLSLRNAESARVNVKLVGLSDELTGKGLEVSFKVVKS